LVCSKLLSGLGKKPGLESTLDFRVASSRCWRAHPSPRQYPKGPGLSSSDRASSVQCPTALLFGVTHLRVEPPLASLSSNSDPATHNPPNLLWPPPRPPFYPQNHNVRSTFPQTLPSNRSQSVPIAAHSLFERTGKSVTSSRTQHSPKVPVHTYLFPSRKREYCVGYTSTPSPRPQFGSQTGLVKWAASRRAKTSRSYLPIAARCSDPLFTAASSVFTPWYCPPKCDSPNLDSGGV